MNEPFISQEEREKDPAPIGASWEWDPEKHDYGWVTKIRAEENQGLTKQSQCEKFLKSLLESGPVDAKTAYAKMADLGFSERVVRLAKLRLNIRSAKRHRVGDVPTSWTWYLGGQEPLGLTDTKIRAEENQGLTLFEGLPREATAEEFFTYAKAHGLTDKEYRPKPYENITKIRAEENQGLREHPSPRELGLNKRFGSSPVSHDVIDLWDKKISIEEYLRRVSARLQGLYERYHG